MHVEGAEGLYTGGNTAATDFDGGPLGASSSAGDWEVDFGAGRGGQIIAALPLPKNLTEKQKQLSAGAAGCALPPSRP